MLKNLKWFTVENRFIYFTCIMIYKCLNNLAPNYLVNLFKYVSGTHSYVTRNVTDDYLALPYPLHYTIVVYLIMEQLYGIALPSEIRHSLSLKQFKSMLSFYLNSCLIHLYHL